MTHLICIVCPKGCHLNVDEKNGYTVTGNGCLHGAEYGKKELTNPTRIITSTVKIKGGCHRRCPVKTDKAIPKNMIFAVMKKLNGIELISPVKCGNIVIKDILGSGADLVVTKSM